MDVRTGTSGFAYKKWKGSFYPPDLKEDGFLAFYAGVFPAVEINNTFYRMPKADVLARWAEAVPPAFRFGLKASRRITHIKRLGEVREEVVYFLEQAAALGDRRGPVLVQLPPNLKKDLDRLQRFLELLPSGVQTAFEFRHPSWEDEDVLAALRGAGQAWCVAETDDDEAPPPLHATARWGYLRLRRTEYDAAALAAWRDRVAGTGWDQAWVFFKHEDEARGPAFARAFQDLPT